MGDMFEINYRFSLGGFLFQTACPSRYSCHELIARCTKCDRADSVSITPVVDGTGTKITCDICRATLVASSQFFNGKT